jgi:hypothetical protein
MFNSGLLSFLWIILNNIDAFIENNSQLFW